MDLKLLSWNVHGLGNRDKRVAVNKGFVGGHPDILVLQETKLSFMDEKVVREIWGLGPNKWLDLPSRGHLEVCL